MKIVHFSDTHLGFNDLDILNDENINQREADFYDSFVQIVEQIKIIKPNFIIHTGDLFHRSSPSNRAISFALEQFKIINSLNIPFILIAGNHSTPRTHLSSPILKICNNFENIHTAYSQEYQKFEFDQAVFHCLPHINDEQNALTQIERCSVVKEKKNIMLMHCSVGAWYLMQEFGEWVYPSDKEYIFETMDYVGLGHWHGFGCVGKHKNVFYSGSTERTSFGDKRKEKGFIVARLEDELKVEFIPINIRAFLEFEIDCEDFEQSVSRLNLTDIKDAICEVRLKNLTTLSSIDINTQDIKDIFNDAMYVSVKREFIKTNHDIITSDASSLEETFLEHLKQGCNDDEFSRIKTKVEEIFSFEVQDDS